MTDKVEDAPQPRYVTVAALYSQLAAPVEAIFRAISDAFNGLGERSYPL